MEIGRAVRRLRNLKGINQEELAIRIDMSIESVGKIESGLSIPRQKNMIKIAEVFGISYDDLILLSVNHRGLKEHCDPVRTIQQSIMDKIYQA